MACARPSQHLSWWEAPDLVNTCQLPSPGNWGQACLPEGGEWYTAGKKPGAQATGRAGDPEDLGGPERGGCVQMAVNTGGPLGGTVRQFLEDIFGGKGDRQGNSHHVDPDHPSPTPPRADWWISAHLGQQPPNPLFNKNKTPPI